MDIGLFLTVLWRAKWVLLGGILFGLVIAALAYGRPGVSGGRPTLTPNTAEVWQSESQLLITQASFPFSQGQTASPPQTGLSELSPVYATLANGDAVQAEIRRQVGVPGKVKASESLDVAISAALPFVNLIATAPTANDATRLAAGAASVLHAYVIQQQTAARIAPSQRVELAVVQSGANTKLVEGHKLTVPLLVFIAILFAVVSLVFLNENVRPRVAAELRRVSSDQTPQNDQTPQKGHTDPIPGSHHETANTTNGDIDVLHEPVETGYRRW